MDNIKILLISYNNATKELIECLDNDDFDNLDALLDKRQEIIESIKELNYTNEEFASIAVELDLLEWEKRLNTIMEEKMNDARKELKKAVSGRSISNAYSKSFNVDPVFFNKKI